jgi:septum formation protein
MFILASKSPRRQELIKKLVPDFICISPDVDENITCSPSALPSEISKLKAYKVFASHPDDVVLACDTIVINDGEIYGKPKNYEDAKRMLKALSGKTHIVLSGYTLISKEKEITRTIKSKVTFNELSEQTISSYLASGSPFDKAGAYGIQDSSFHLIKKIAGSFDSVMGLPTEDIKKYLFLK